MPRQSIIPKEIREIILERNASGIAWITIAKELNINPSTVRNYLYSLGYKFIPYVKVPVGGLICEKCGKEHNGMYGSGRFCSIHCCKSKTWTKEQREKLSETCKKSEKVKLANKIAGKARIGFKRSNDKNGNPIKKKELNIQCKYCNKKIEGCKNKHQMYHKECYMKVAGGYRKGSGQGKAGWYKGIYCDSSYELAYLIYNLDKGINITRCKQSFKYSYNGKEHTYIPDFIVDNTIIEIKGYITDRDEYKWASVDTSFEVIDKYDIKPYIKYVVDKYGSDFIRLFEGNPYKNQNNSCLHCNKQYNNKNKFCSKRCMGLHMASKRFGKKYM